MNYLATYTTIPKKQDRDYYWRVMFYCVAETSKASNSCHASYPSTSGRAINIVVDFANQRLIAAISLLLISQCVWQRSMTHNYTSSRYKPSKPWVLHRNMRYVVPHTHNEVHVMFTTNVHFSWKNACELEGATHSSSVECVCTKRCTRLFASETRAQKGYTHLPKTVNEFAVCAKRNRSECGRRSLSVWNGSAPRVSRVCFIPCIWWVLYFPLVF